MAAGQTEPTTPSGGLEGYSAIVTGGGTGIGAACAAPRRRRRGGHDLRAHRARARRGRADRRAVVTAGVQHVVADVTDEDDVAMTAAAVDLGGRLDGVVANAGGGRLGPYHLQDTDEFIRVLHLNVLGTMLCVKHTVPHLVAAGGGSFVGMSSIAGHVTHRTSAPTPRARPASRR